MTWKFADKEELATESECWITPRWAVDSILRAELLTHRVIDPCCGDGVMGDACIELGHNMTSTDLYDWDYGMWGVDFLEGEYPKPVKDNTIIMNPPFSKAEEFVKRCFDLGARKIVCFQRFAWWESRRRRRFWGKYAPNRLYVLGDRASCWLIHIPPEKRNVPKSKGGAGSGTTTAHAWYVWERGHPPGTQLRRLYR